MFRIKAHTIILAVGIVLVICGSAQETKALGIEFTNYTAIDFGEMSAGDIKDEVPYERLIIRCTASSGTPGWTLKVKIDHPLTHESNPASIIPNTNFKWYLVNTSDANNNPTNLEQRTEFTTYDQTVYTGLAGEAQTDIEMKFQLELPTVLQWGTYSTNYGKIVFTLTE
jgi:hypothetical protein